MMWRVSTKSISLLRHGRERSCRSFGISIATEVGLRGLCSKGDNDEEEAPEDTFRGIHLGGFRSRLRRGPGLGVHSSRGRGAYGIDASQAICRRSLVQLKRAEEVDDFIQVFQSTVLPAYSKQGFLGACLLVAKDRDDKKEKIIESQTFWTSLDSLEANNASSEYQKAMQSLVRYLADAPEVYVYTMPAFTGFAFPKGEHQP